MKREEEIQKKTEKFEDDRQLRMLLEASEDMSMDEFQKYARDFIKPLDDLFKKIRRLQEDGLKSDIHYIGICFLHHTFQKGSLELLAEAYDEKLLFDTMPVSIQYSPELMSRKAKQDWDDYVKYMNSAVIRIKYHELHPYLLKLAEAYKKLIGEILGVFAPVIVNLESFRKIKVSDKLIIGFGEYGCTTEAIFGGSNENDNEAQ